MKQMVSEFLHPRQASLVERAVRAAIALRWGSGSESDRITDHLDLDRPDYVAAWRAHRALAGRQREE